MPQFAYSEDQRLSPTDQPALPSSEHHGICPCLAKLGGPQRCKPSPGTPWSPAVFAGPARPLFPFARVRQQCHLLLFTSDGLLVPVASFPFGRLGKKATIQWDIRTSFLILHIPNYGYIHRYHPSMNHQLFLYLLPLL